MENASKALLMSASILLGLMIVTVGVVLFKSFGGFSREITTEIEKKQIAQFNAQFQKYEGYVNFYDEETKKETTEIIKITTHDIVTIANLAQKNNKEYELEKNLKSEKENETTYYVQINLNDGTNNKNRNLEKWKELELTNFIENNNMENNEIKYYFIKNIVISNITGRVTYVEIQKL